VSVELRPLGVHCNIACQYCYQHPQRDAGNLARRYDLEAMKAAVLADGGPFTLFGGEPLLVPIADLEALWSWGLAHFGENGVQTNGTLITDEHLRLFRAYKVHVGISLDGPGELNDARWVGTEATTREASARVEAILARLLAEGYSTSLIVTLHRGNATEAHLPRMYEWLRGWDRRGLKAARLHVLEVDHAAVRAQYALSIEENLRALLGFARFEAAELRGLRLDLFADIEGLLRGRDRRASCVWRSCDPYTTTAVRGVEGHGQRSNCGRTNKDGIDFVKADAVGYERYLALASTPQAHGGCRDCRFFLMCKGQCPGTAIDGDWRNRTEHCAVWMALFEHVEARLIAAGETPLSCAAIRPVLEALMARAWEAGQNPSLAELVAALSPAVAAPDPAGAEART